MIYSPSLVMKYFGGGWLCLFCWYFRCPSVSVLAVAGHPWLFFVQYQFVWLLRWEKVYPFTMSIFFFRYRLGIIRTVNNKFKRDISDVKWWNYTYHASSPSYLRMLLNKVPAIALAGVRRFVTKWLPAFLNVYLNTFVDYIIPALNK